jgi:hypothetical protein
MVTVTLLVKDVPTIDNRVPPRVVPTAGVSAVIVGAERPKVALTLVALDITTWQVAFPVHAPLHAPSEAPASGVAVSVTVDPDTKSLLHVDPQTIPAGLLVTVPGPVLEIVSVKTASNVAVTVRAAVIDTTQVPVPEHAPDQPVKRAPAIGVAVSATVETVGYCAVQSDPQLIPGTLLVTTPPPLPAFVMVSGNV